MGSLINPPSALLSLSFPRMCAKVTGMGRGADTKKGEGVSDMQNA